jgi:DNA-binding CsgD family transcriptional regulator
MARHLAPSCAREGTASQPHAEVVGELHLPPEHYLIVHLPSSDPPARWPQEQSAASASDELAMFVLGDVQFCIVRAAGLGGADASTLTEILTARELQIASLVALGRLNKQIAAQLHISEWTVATHVRRVFCKLGVSTRAGMVYRCAPLIGRRPDLDG